MGDAKKEQWMRERNGEWRDSSVDAEMEDWINRRKDGRLPRRMSSWKEINFASMFFICIRVFSYNCNKYIFVVISDL
jgi:hypothetical protein